MAITLADFTKIWASTSPLTPYSFSDSNYQEGWNFVGSTPPARQMWDFLQKNNDEKMKFIVDNFVPLSGGTMTGTLILDDGGTALSNATVGTVVTDNASTVSVTSGVATDIVHIDLPKGTWVVTGTLAYASIIAGRQFAGLNTSVSITADTEGTIVHYSDSANGGTLGLNTSRIFVLGSASTVYLIGYASSTVTANKGIITAVRIK